jgi:hypothetical protein
MFDFKTVLKLKRFDRITEFRLLNAFIIALSFSILSPVITALEGSLIVPYLIAAFSIASTLAVKTNKFLTERYNLRGLFHVIVVLHFLFFASTLVYFWSPLMMIYLDVTLGIVEAAFVSAYSILLTNHINENYPKDMHDFQIARNNIWSDGTIFGLSISTVIIFVFGMQGAVISFLILNFFFNLWLVKNWNFFD